MSTPTTPSPDSSSSASLLHGLRAGSELAWEQLVEIYAPLVKSWCQIAGVPAPAVADVVQDVFLAVHRKVADFEPQPKSTGFRGWLWMITRNRVYDYFRKSRTQATGGTTANTLLQEVADPELPDEAPSEPNQISAMLHRAMQFVQCEFQERTWLAFWRTVVEGEETAAVADDLGVSPAAIRQSRARVLRRLREQLGDVR